MSNSNIQPLYLDPSRPIAERVRDLIGRLTWPEKVSQLRHRAAAIPRLGIPAYNYWSEALHGVARNGRATVFPQAIGLAATWDPELLGRIGSAIGDEARAKYHDLLRHAGESGYNQGLTFWSPNVNIFRDPRWGRGQETYGEDPFLTGKMGVAFVRGMQGEDPHYLKAAACGKHFAVHSGPEALRHGFDARVSLRDLHDTYLPAFHELVAKARVEAIMGAYNRTNGEPCCAHPYLMSQVLRDQWNFAGHFVSDCGAVRDIYAGHHAAGDPAAAAALALQHGCDLECGDTYRYLDEALQRGLIAEADADRALERTLTTRFKLGMFDPPEVVPYAATPMSVVGCETHRQLAYEAALKSIVLLKNQDQLLPLGPKVRSIRLLGPMAADVNVLLGNYFGLNDSLTTILEGVTGRAPDGVRLEYRPAVQVTQANTSRQDWLFDPAAQPDVVIACMGITPLLEGEEGDAIASPAEGDRTDIALPQVQADFIRQLAASGVSIVLVLTGGGPIVLDDIADLVQAILFVWYPGQEGGAVVADVLFGHAAPSGRLPVTFPQSAAQLPPFDDYGMAGRTYRYMAAAPLYPFGFGLAYTVFDYSALTLASEQVASGEGLPGQVTVRNVGALAGEEVIQFYLSDLSASVPVPFHKLIGFRRIHLQPGESKIVSFEITPEAMMLVDDGGRWVLEPGQFRLTVGGCSPGSRGLALGAPAPVSALFTVRGLRDE
ncbi:MAG: glycoside hydrolase family 3 C-terminal domain-containing protein [Chloroflexi bacterium]|nr:glycoside hydrolase family 3 C-terminal domain-containing protein [Chloroflexota bacterium]MCI0643705.1 glycoside hydrolase family 3 C-terminal domain-containing protein [Chloroflexota bacterium]MCI0729755.1 glycoside hydrolase family 3 C-terminal domain-containing protein [Chloroflexota bacterium]